MATSLKFVVGHKLDVYSERDKAWIIGIIIELKQQQIKINYFTWSDKYDMWFDKESQYLAPLNTHTIPIITLSTPPQYEIDSPSTCILHDNDLIICTQNGICK